MSLISFAVERVKANGMEKFAIVFLFCFDWKVCENVLDFAIFWIHLIEFMHDW